jgi:molybdopterin molybdotransferase
MRSVEEHQRVVLGQHAALPTVTVPLLEAQGHVLAVDIAAEWPLPSFDNSSMDGYAVQARDLAAATEGTPVSLPVIGDVAAGHLPESGLRSGTAIRIMTGAPLPEGADAVVPVEWTDAGTDTVVIRQPADVGAHLRRRGEDVAAGEIVVRAGTPVTARTIALLAASGHAQLSVHRAPRVAVISTGDELVEPGTPLEPGRIADSNSFMLMAAVREAGGEAYRCGPVRDDEETLERVLRTEAERADVILTTGGVSMGAYDTVKAVLTRVGGVDFVKVAMQPGMPQGSGSIEGTTIVTLPGNPVSAYVSFEAFVRPLLRRLAGYAEVDRPRREMSCGLRFTSPPGKMQFARVQIAHDGARERAIPEGAQGSHILGGLARADGLAVVPADVTVVDVGDPLTIIDLREAL